MDALAFEPSGLLLVLRMVVLLTLVILGTLLYLSRRRPKGSPPVVNMGIPVLGNLLSFIQGRGPIDVMWDCYKKYGPVFTIPMGHKRLTFLIGAEQHAPMFKSKDDVMSQDEVYHFMKPVFGAGVVYDAPLNKRQEQMQTCAKGLRTANLQSHVPMIEAEVRAFIKNWGDSGELNLSDAISEMTILTASRCLHGPEVRENMFADVARLYNDLEEMVSIFSKVIRKRLEEEKNGKKTDKTDLLQAFIDMRYRDGTRLTDDQIAADVMFNVECGWCTPSDSLLYLIRDCASPKVHVIVGLLIAMLFAGQHTTTIASTWISVFVAAHRDIEKRLVEEQKEALGCDSNSKALTYEGLGKMELLHNCMLEVLRMNPPLIMLMRYARKSITVTSEGNVYNIPPGDICVASPALSMRLPEAFREPDKFDPDRYAVPREEHKQPFAYIGFGAGMHQCIGQQFGAMQVKTVMSVLLREYQFELLDDFPKPDYKAMVVGPEGKCRVRYQRRKGV